VRLDAIQPPPCLISGEIGKMTCEEDPELLRGRIAFFNTLGNGRILSVLDRIGPDSRTAVPELIEYLADPESIVRSSAARVLGWLGPDARDAVPAMIRALKDPESMVRCHATVALGCIGPDAVPDLIEALGDPTWSVRLNAAVALASIVPDVWDAMPELFERLRAPDEGIRDEVRRAIGRPLRDS
jgi:HEAT repeat protein